MSEKSEWQQIKKFVAECRRQWPGAMIVLRPNRTDAASQGATRAPSEPPAPGHERIFPMADDFLEHDLDTPTEADLDLAYGSQYLSATDIGDRKIRTKIAKVRKADLRGNDDKKRMKFNSSTSSPSTSRWWSTPRKLICIWLIGGSAGSILTMRCLTIRHSRSIVTAAFVTATYSGRYSRQLCLPA